MSIEPDLATWTKIIEEEEAGDVAGLGHMAEELYAELGCAHQEVIRLRAELHDVASRHLPGTG